MTGQDTSQKRSSLLRKNIITSFLIKGWSAIVVFLMVPVTLHCLGDYKNGVWLTISSLLLWIDNMDIGLGNGLRNKLAAHIAHGETTRARSLVSSFIFKLTGNFYMGLQLPAVSNLLIALGQTLALIGTYAVYLSGSHSLMHIALVNTAAPLIVYVLAYPITFHSRYPQMRPSLRLVNLSEAKEVMSMGIKFFIMQISSVVLFMSANILISKLFSPAMVTPYTITYRYFSLMLVVFTVICMPYWNATTDAYERGDMQWIRSANQKLNLMTVLIFIGMCVMVAVSGLVYSVWIGDEVSIDIRMSIAMAAYIFILIYSMRYSFFINGIGKLWLQQLFTVSAAIIFIPLAYTVAHWSHDIIWFVAVMCLVNIPGLVVNRIQFGKLINGQATGAWNR